MELVMCRSCGHFQHAVPRDGTLESLRDDCEKCGNAEFLDTRTDEMAYPDV